MEQNQVPLKETDLVVTAEQLTVEYWRKQFAALKNNFTDLIDLAEQVGVVEPEFAGIRGYFKLENVSRNRAALQPTAKAVQAINTVLTNRGLKLA